MEDVIAELDARIAEQVEIQHAAAAEAIRLRGLILIIRKEMELAQGGRDAIRIQTGVSV